MRQITEFDAQKILSANNTRATPAIHGIKNSTSALSKRQPYPAVLFGDQLSIPHEAIIACVAPVMRSEHEAQDSGQLRIRCLSITMPPKCRFQERSNPVQHCSESFDLLCLCMCERMVVMMRLCSRNIWTSVSHTRVSAKTLTLCSGGAAKELCYFLTTHIF